MSPNLLYVNIFVLDPSHCSGGEYVFFDSNKQYCAGIVEGGKDACFVSIFMKNQLSLHMYKRSAIIHCRATQEVGSLAAAS